MQWLNQRARPSDPRALGECVCKGFLGKSGGYSFIGLLVHNFPEVWGAFMWHETGSSTSAVFGGACSPAFVTQEASLSVLQRLRRGELVLSRVPPGWGCCSPGACWNRGAPSTGQLFLSHFLVEPG